ncbi:MAG: ABC transporter ATP-binding protein [Planctomycetota bacterium]
MNAVVEVGRLVKSYGRVRAVDEVSFRVSAGEAVALMGPNGSGKTTILRCVAGLLRPDGGVVKVAGLDLRRDYREARRQFSFLPQQPGFPAYLTAREVVAFHARLRGLARGRAVAALREAGVGEEEQRKAVHALSGGMRQRLSLAVAGLAPVRLMVLDEPTGSLDPEAALRLRSQARRWRDEGRALLFATHVLDDVEELADRAVLLVDGRVVAERSVADLLAEMRQLAVLRLDLEQPTEAHVEAALAGGATQAQLNGQKAILVTAPVERRLAILDRLRELGPVRHFETEKPSIEHLYLSYLAENRNAGG